MTTTEAAIDDIVRAWGVEDADKVAAIRYVLQGADPVSVVQAITEISNGLGHLKALAPKVVIDQH